MKPSILIVSLLSSLAAATANDLNNQLSLIDSNFQKSGPSLDILNDYDSLLRQLNSESSGGSTKTDVETSAIISKIYYKKALVELSLGKDLNSIENFAKSLELNPNNPVVKSKLLDICIKYGLKDRLYSFKTLFNGEDSAYLDALSTVNSVETLASSDDLSKLNEAINISPFDPQLRLKRIELTTKDIQESNDLNKFADLVDDMSSLVKINPINYSKYLNKLSEIYLYGLSEFQNSLSFNKKCLHYDMDNDLCKKNSKFLNKYSPILQNISNFHKFFTFLNEKEETNEEIIFDDNDLKNEAIRLQDSNQFLKIRRENENFKTNLEYLLHKASSFNNEYQLKSNQLQISILKTLTFDGFLRGRTKILSNYGKKLTSISPEEKESFLPIILANVDVSINRKDFQRAKQLLSKISPNGKKTSYYKERIQRIQQHDRQQEQQQRQQYHQQMQKPRGPPKNDYYKILDIPKDSDSTTIRKAYREMTKKYHPDKYKGDLSQDQIEAKMTQINHAYEVLSDPDLRAKYDQGEDPNDPESMHGGGSGGNGHPGGAPRGNPFGGAGNPFGNGGFNFNFGGNRGGPGGFRFGNSGGNSGFKFGNRKKRSR